MTDTNAPKPAATWLDNWLDSLIRSSDLGPRVNLITALAVLGGRDRMTSFARLVGESAVRMKKGESRAIEVVDAALEEVRSPGFSKDNQRALYEALELSSGWEPAHRTAARALLLPGNSFWKWWRLRHLTPRPRLLPGLILPLQVTASAMALLGITSLTSPFDSTTFGANMAILGIAGLIAWILGLIGGRLSTSGLQNLQGLLLETGCATLVFLAPATALALLAYSIERGLTALFFMDAFIFAIGVGLVRLFCGLLPVRGRLVTDLMAATGWPIAFVTAYCVAAQWLVPSFLHSESGTFTASSHRQVVGTLWIGFLLFAPAYAAAVRQVSILRPSHIASSIARLGRDRAGLPATIVLLVAVGLVCAATDRSRVLKFPTADAVTVSPYEVDQNIKFKIRSQTAPILLLTRAGQRSLLFFAKNERDSHIAVSSESQLNENSSMNDNGVRTVNADSLNNNSWCIASGDRSSCEGDGSIILWLPNLVRKIVALDKEIFYIRKDFEYRKLNAAVVVLDADRSAVAPTLRVNTISGQLTKIVVTKKRRIYISGPIVDDQPVIESVNGQIVIEGPGKAQRSSVGQSLDITLEPGHYVLCVLKYQEFRTCLVPFSHHLSMPLEISTPSNEEVYNSPMFPTINP